MYEKRSVTVVVLRSTVWAILATGCACAVMRMWDSPCLPSKRSHPKQLPCNLGFSGAPEWEQTDAYRQAPTPGESPIALPRIAEARLNDPRDLEDSSASPHVNSIVVWDPRRARCHSRYYHLPSLTLPAPLSGNGGNTSSCLVSLGLQRWGLAHLR